ncbi:uncharacterized protein rrp8 isoform X2 [Vanacampus margaritifer]
MFNEEEDWNDAADLLSQSVEKTKPNSSSSSNVKLKNVGKKSLLRTLQTLGSIPDWKDDGQRQPDSDSDTEDVVPHIKRKKKRGKRTKPASMTTGKQENNADDVKQKKTVAKKEKVEKKIGVEKRKKAPAGETAVKESPQMSAEDALKLSRKKWRQKMKNKRKYKNKYRPTKPEAEVEKDDQPTTRSHISSGGKQEKKTVLQKRKTSEGHHNADTSPIKRAKKETSVNGSRREAADWQPRDHKAEKLKREHLRKLLRPASPEEAEPKEEEAEPKEEEAEPKEEEAEPVALAGKEVKEERSTSLRARMEQRLEAARFRYINQFLYSSSSGEAKRMFQQDPQAFAVYHKGFTAQVRRWPANPLDAIVNYIRNKPPSLVVADFGCGDCKIALSVKNKVHNFDLVATCDLVTVCDMAHVPLQDSSVDIAVFCLSLMGTNLAAFLAEANRVLKKGGVLKIAEVASRFGNVRNFITALAKLGFKLESKDTENTHFYSFHLTKTDKAPENVKNFGLQLKACLYKKR